MFFHLGLFSFDRRRRYEILFFDIFGWIECVWSRWLDLFLLDRGELFWWLDLLSLRGLIEWLYWRLSERLIFLNILRWFLFTQIIFLRSLFNWELWRLYNRCYLFFRLLKWSHDSLLLLYLLFFNRFLMLLYLLNRFKNILLLLLLNNLRLFLCVIPRILFLCIILNKFDIFNFIRWCWLRLIRHLRVQKIEKCIIN